MNPSRSIISFSEVCPSTRLIAQMTKYRWGLVANLALSSANCFLCWQDREILGSIPGEILKNSRHATPLLLNFPHTPLCYQGSDGSCSSFINAVQMRFFSGLGHPKSCTKHFVQLLTNGWLQNTVGYKDKTRVGRAKPPRKLLLLFHLHQQHQVTADSTEVIPKADTTWQFLWGKRDKTKQGVPMDLSPRNDTQEEEKRIHKQVQPDPLRFNWFSNPEIVRDCFVAV